MSVQPPSQIFHPVFNDHTNTTDDVPYSWDLPYYHPPRVSDRKFSNLSFSMWPVPPGDGGPDDMPDGFITSNAVKMLSSVTAPSESQVAPFFVAMGLVSELVRGGPSVACYERGRSILTAAARAPPQHRPHLPWTAPEHFWDLYPISSVAMPAWPFRPRGFSGAAERLGFDPQSGPRHCEDVQALNVTFPDGYIPLEYGRRMKQAYLASTSFVDSQVGRALAALHESGRFENTTIVFLGDHGEAAGRPAAASRRSIGGAPVIAPRAAPRRAPSRRMAARRAR